MTDPMAALELRGLRKDYDLGDGRVSALAGVDLRIAAGSSVAVLGPSGSGKSTLLGLVAGLDRPSAGQVLLEGRDLASLDEAALADLRARRIGFIFQSYRLLQQCTALENVRTPLELRGDPPAAAAEQARHWLERVGLGARMQHLPNRLSGGEQQRVAVARAMAIGPGLLFADEPTGNLDSATGAAIAELLLGIAADGACTLVYVTHDHELAARAGRRVHLQDGRVVADDGAPSP